jgi:dihydroflavonol-4-reductase
MTTILVTGASGLVGSHAVGALSRAGHTVRVLARDERRLVQALKPFGVEADVVIGDMTNPADIAKAVAGCRAVVHAAAVIGIARQTSGFRLDENLVGTEVLLSAALAAGVDPVVYLSSVAAYVPTADPVITPDSPLGDPAGGYAASKRDVEQLVRRLQVSGAAITTLVLGAVYGPPSPHPTSSYASILRAAKSGMMAAPPTGIGVVDVRDVAEFIVGCMKPGKGPRRYLLGGHFVSWHEWAELLASAAGRPVRSMPLSVDDLVDLGKRLDGMRATGENPESALSEEAALVLTSMKRTDDSATFNDIGRSLRPLGQTFRDTVDYLRQIGLLDDAIARPDSQSR